VSVTSINTIVTLHLIKTFDRYIIVNEIEAVGNSGDRSTMSGVVRVADWNRFQMSATATTYEDDINQDSMGVNVHWGYDSIGLAAYSVGSGSSFDSSLGLSWSDNVSVFLMIIHYLFCLTRMMLLAD
jgi:hypothetical protein